MSDPEQLGVQLVFIPEAYGGMDGGAFDAYRVCEVMARKDIGLATSVFATFLGSDPIVVGATEEQKQRWLGAIAEEGVVFAYGATEPEAGSDLSSLTTTASPVLGADGEVTAYRINGRRQCDFERQYRRLRDHPGGHRGRAVLVRRAQAHRRVQLGATGGQARHPAVQHRRALPRRRRGSR